MPVSEENTRVIFTISKELKGKLENQAKKDNRSIGNYLVTLIQKHIEEMEQQKDD